MLDSGTLNPDKYDRFFRDKNYAVEPYCIAEPYLDIITDHPGIKHEITPGELARALEQQAKSCMWDRHSRTRARSDPATRTHSS